MCGSLVCLSFPQLELGERRPRASLLDCGINTPVKNASWYRPQNDYKGKIVKIVFLISTVVEQYAFNTEDTKVKHTNISIIYNDN
jgi:hypothetical protein